MSAQFVMSGGFRFQFSGSWSYEEFRTPWEGDWRLHGSEGSLRWGENRIEVVRGSARRVIEVPSLPSDHTLGATLEEFTAALAERRRPTTDIEDNLKTVAMVFGAIRSSESGAPVSIGEMIGEAGGS